VILFEQSLCHAQSYRAVYHGHLKHLPPRAQIILFCGKNASFFRFRVPKVWVEVRAHEITMLHAAIRCMMRFVQNGAHPFST